MYFEVRALHPLKLLMVGITILILWSSAARADTDPFIGHWKFVPEQSRFDRSAPRDIKLKFVIENGRLREEEETILPDGTPRVAVFIHDYDGQEHSFTMSGETRHRVHSVLWTRVDNRTIERRINHDNGQEYTTERLVLSADGDTLTETHRGKNSDGSSYEVTETFVRQNRTP